jgi:RND family efflux transporter MFP subunit
VLGPLLESKRRDDRWIARKLLESLWTQLGRLLGARYLGRKLAVLTAVCLVAFFYFVRDDYRVTSPAIIEGLVQRVVVAPFDSYIASEHARAGEIVRKGAVLATLDDKDLTLERLRWSTTRRQRLTEYNRALAARGRADINIIKAQIEQAKAQIALLDEQIARTKLKAPFDGIVVSGDLSQSIGAAVQRGQELFTVTPLDSYRVILEVDESEISQLKVGQEGTLLVSSLPKTPLDYHIERITPVSESKEGRTFFRVQAKLMRISPRLRPGMEGIGKTHIDVRRLIWIWTHSLIDWVRLQIWKWRP